MPGCAPRPLPPSAQSGRAHRFFDQIAKLIHERAGFASSLDTRSVYPRRLTPSSSAR
jgi:hypothetical protein